MPESIVEHDLAVFFRISFENIRSDFNTDDEKNNSEKLPDDWPGDDTIHELVSRSKPLFIFAATLCLFVSGPNNGIPKDLLAKVLDYAATGSPLSQTYRPVLDAQLNKVPASLRAGIIKDFILVVGSIIILAEPLGISSLATLLAESRETIYARLRLLHAVLRVPQDDSPVRLLHLSFRDYLLDPNSEEHGTNQFHIDQDHAHRTVAERCIRLMRGHPLRQNIAGLSFPGMLRSDVDPEQLAAAIPPTLHYACRYWIHHWASSKFWEHGGVAIHNFLKDHLLYWFEAMSLLGHLGEALYALSSLLSWMQTCHSLDELSEFLFDAIRFLRLNFSIIERAPLQIYSSALALSPTQSIVKKTFFSHIPPWLTLQPPVRDTWDACLTHLHDTSYPRSVTFSHDSERLAAAFWGYIYVWIVETGELEAGLFLEREAPSFSRAPFVITFSKDSELLASSHGPTGPTIYVWTVQTGNLVRRLAGRLEGPKYEAVVDLSFSAESRSVFSGSNNGKIRAWDLESGACTLLFDPRHGEFYRLINGYPSSPLVLHAAGGRAHVCGTGIQEYRALLEGQEHGKIHMITATASSHNHERIVIASSVFKIGCWNAITGKPLNEVSVQHENGNIVSMTFCGQSQSLIAAGTNRGSIYLWNVDTGEFSEMRASRDFSARRFKPTLTTCSPNGRLAASCDGESLIWDINALKHQVPLKNKEHPEEIKSLFFSHDTRVVVSSYRSGSLHIWDLEAGTSEDISKKHPLPRILEDYLPGPETLGPLWELLGNSHGRVCVPEEEDVLAVKFSKTCGTLAVASNAKGTTRIQIWDVMAQQKVQSLESFQEGWDTVDFMFFSDDSKMLAA